MLLRVIDEVQFLALARIIRSVGDEDCIGSRVFAFEINGIFGDIAARQRHLVRIEREALHHVQLIAVRHRRIEEARQESCRIDDQRIAFPMSDGMSRAAEL